MAPHRSITAPTLCLFCALLAAGCGTGNTPADGAASPDMATSPDLLIPYPAPHPAPPEAQTAGGPVTANPKFVAITFAGDPLQASIDDFTTKLAASTYWAGTTAEYGVGKATALPPIHVGAMAPKSISDNAIQQWLAMQIKSTPNFPQPDADTLYSIYYPDTTTVTTDFGASCKGFQGYHNDFVLKDGKTVSYIVLGRCPPPVKSVTVLDNLTATASHEAMEAATDPVPVENPAWNAVDDDHVAWSYLGGGGELGDICAAFPNSFYRPADLPYLVQRTWSNKAAKAGHDPCEPDGTSPFFNSIPVYKDSISVPVPGVLGGVTSKGLKIPVGQSETVELDLYSDGPTSGPWTVSGVDLASAFKGGMPDLEFSFDKTTGTNGDKIMMTVKALKASKSGVSIFWIKNDLGTASTVWLGLVVNG